MPVTPRYHLPAGDIMGSMRQLLLRVPDELHARLAARAAREGRSVNQVAGEILDAAADADRGDARSRLRARAAANGSLAPVVNVKPLTAEARAAAIASTRGLGPFVDAYFEAERDRP